MKKEDIRFYKFESYVILNINETLSKSKLEGYANRKDNKEHHIIIDKDGKVFEKVGTENSVDSFSSKLDGSISLHNHLENSFFSV